MDDWSQVIDDTERAANTADASAAVPQPKIDPQGEVPPSGESSWKPGDFTVHALGGGVEAAVRGTVSTAREVGNAVIHGLTPPFLREKVGRDVLPDPLAGTEPLIEPPTHTINQIAKDVVQFGLGLVGGKKILEVGSAGLKLPNVVKEVVESGVGTGVVADPHAPRLSNLIEKYPILSNPVTEYLAADPTDGVAEGKFKAAMEDMLTTPVALTLFHGVKALKNKLTDGADVDAVEQSLKAADEVAETGPKSKYQENIVETNGASLSPEPSTNGKRLVTEAGDEFTSTTPDMSLTAHMDNGSMYIDRIEVQSELRGKGTGTVAVKELEDYARQKGATKVTGDALPGSEEFWKKNGFTVGEPAEGVGLRPIVKDLNGNGAPKKPEPIFKLDDTQKMNFLDTVNRALEVGDLNSLDNVNLSNAFNYSKMGSAQDVKMGIDELAKTLSPVLDKNVKNYQSLKSIEQAATFFGTKPDRLLANLSTWGVNAKDMASTVVAGKMMAQSLADDIFKSARYIHINGADEAAKVELMRKIDILSDVEGMTKSIQKAAARTTAAGRIRTTAQYNSQQIQDLMNSVGGKENIDALAQKIALSEGDPARVAKMLRDTKFGKLIDTHNELWLNGILSGVKTHVVNMSSAVVQSLYQPMNLMVGGVARRDWDAVREGVAVYSALRKSTFDSLDMARRAFASEKAILDPGKGTGELATAISSKNYSLDPESWGATAVDWLGTMARIPSRFLKAEDEFFKQMNYRAKMTAQSSREASDLIRQGKLDPKKMVDAADGGKISEVAKWIDDRFNSSFTPEGAGLDEVGLNWARTATFTQDLNADTWLGNRSFSESLQTVANSHPILRGTVLPFVRVPANLMRAVADSNFVSAPLKKQFWSDLQAGGEKANMAIGKAATGSMLWGGAVTMALEGRITGGAPGDKEIRDRLMETGWQPYSFVFGDGDKKTYISFQRLDPYSSFFGLAADFGQIANSVDEKVRNHWAVAASLALAQNISSKSYLKGIVEMSSMLGAGYSKEEVVQRMINMKASSYIPQWVNLYNGDDELKKVRSITDALMAKIPGMSSMVEAKRDYFGEKKLAPMGYPWSAIDPFAMSHEKGDAVQKELARLSTSEAEANFTVPSEKLGTLDLSQIKNANGQSAYDRWTELMGQVSVGGRTFKEKLADLIQSPRYQAGTDGTSAYHTGSRVVMIRNEQTRYREAALRQMLDEFDGQAGKLGFNLKDLHRQDTRNDQLMQRGREPQGLDALEALKP